MTTFIIRQPWQVAAAGAAEAAAEEAAAATATGKAGHLIANAYANLQQQQLQTIKSSEIHRPMSA